MAPAANEFEQVGREGWGDGPKFSVETARSVSSVVVYVHGELDAATAPALRQVLRDLIESQGDRSIVVDVGDMTFMDSSGLRVLVAALLNVQDRGGALVLEGASAQTLRVLEMTGAQAFFDGTRRPSGRRPLDE